MTPGSRSKTPFPFKAMARFADNLYRARELAGLDQMEAAKRAAVTRSRLDKIEGGENVPSLDVLIRLAGYEEAISATEEIATGLGNIPGMAQVVARLLFNLGLALKDAGRREQAISAFEDAVTCFGDSPHKEHRRMIAEALCGKGFLLWKLGRPEEAFAVSDEVVERFGEVDDPSLIPPVAMALFQQGMGLAELGRPEEALVSLEQALAAFRALPPRGFGR